MLQSITDMTEKPIKSVQPVFHIFYYTGEIYKTIYATKVETSKCRNNVWNENPLRYSAPKEKYHVEYHAFVT